jgi:peroxiredoxin Q/BCP
MGKQKMHRSTPILIAGLVFAAACIACLVLDYQLAAAITGLLAVLFSSLSVKEAAGNPGIYSSFAIAVLFGYSVSPAGTYFLSVSMFFLALEWNARLMFFRNMGNGKFIYQELLTYIAGLGIFVAGDLIEHVGWMSWVFPGIAYLFGLILAFVFTYTNRNVAQRISDFFGVKPGSMAPDFALQDEDGNNVSLSDYKGKSHVLLIFLRGDWCPTCHIMLRTYEKNKEKFASKNIMLLAIGPDPIGVNKELLQHLGLKYKLLSDDKNGAAKAYGMTFMTITAGLPAYVEGVPLPAAFLIDINGKVAYTSNPRKPGEILKPDTIFPVIESLKLA